MTDIARRYESKPQLRWATEAVTADNRTDVMEWVLRWGGRCALTPDGYEVALVLYTPGGERDVPYGYRVIYNEVQGGDFHPISPETFEAGWRALTDVDEASD